MGLFSSKSSSSSSVTNNSQNIGADDSIVATDGASVSLLDGDAISKAFEGSAAALDQVFRFARDSLGTVERNAGASQRSFETALASTLAITDEKETDGTRRLLWLAVAAMIALGVIAGRK